MMDISLRVESSFYDNNILDSDVKGKIYRFDEATQYETETEIGDFSFFYLDFSRIRWREDIHDLFDAPTSHSAEYYEVAKKLIKEIDPVDMWIYPGNILIANEVWIMPEHRGRGYAIDTLNLIFRHFAKGCGYIMMRPCPIRDGRDRGDIEAGVIALTKYYTKNLEGFKIIPHDDMNYLVKELESNTLADWGDLI